jgi:hypothetical protein
MVNSSGQLGTIQSSAWFKDDIKPMDETSEAILSLNPVPSAASKTLIQTASRSSG